MIVEKMKAYIETKSRELARNNALLASARDGKLRRDQVITYLHNLMHLFTHTTINLDRAIKRANELGMDELAEFMVDKKGEEAGHEQWAKDDLRSYRAPAPGVDSARIVPGLHELLQYLEEKIDEDPTQFLAYMVFSEYFTVIVAPEFLDHLENRCGVPRSMMTSIANHEELDRDHVADDFEVIERLVRTEDSQRRLFEVLEASVPRIDRLLAECVSHA